MTDLTISIDKSENNPDWDQFVHNSGMGHFVQTSSWGQVKQSQGWNVVRVIIKSPAKSICGGAQVLYKKYFGFILLLQLIYGPIYEQNNHEMAFSILNEIKKYFRKSPFFLFVQPNGKDWDLHKELLNAGYQTNLHVDIEELATILIDVSKDLEDILLQIKKGKRTRFRQSVGRGVFCYETCCKDDLETFYELHKNIAEKNNFEIQSKIFFDALWDQFKPLDQLHLFMAKIDELTVASILTITYKDTLYTYRIGWLEGFNHFYPNEGIYWYVLQWAYQHDFHWFDFGGIDIDAANSTLDSVEMEEWITHTYSAFKLHICDQVVLEPGTVEYINPKWLSVLIQWVFTNRILNQFMKKVYSLIRKR